MPVDRLKIGRDYERKVATAMCQNGFARAYWIPPRAKYAAIARNTGQDVFGVFDFVGIDHSGAVIGVQVCRKRPGEISFRKAKIQWFCNSYNPAIRSFLAYYDKRGMFVEELMPDFVWRLKALLPYEVDTPVRENPETP